MRSVDNSPVDWLFQKLELLVFFHLGADATLTFKTTPKGVVADVRHSRIEPFELEISFEELTDQAEDSQRVEELFLDQLVKNRRG